VYWSGAWPRNLEKHLKSQRISPWMAAPGEMVPPKQDRNSDAGKKWIGAGPVLTLATPRRKAARSPGI
jgi:hypothetical protein